MTGHAPHLAAGLAGDLTLSVVSHGHGALLAALLDDLDAAPPLAGVAVVVTLNIDEDVDAADYPNLRITLVRNRQPKGFGANHNAAFGHCATRWFAVLNPDLRLDGGEPFTRLADVARGIANVAALAPRIVSVAGTTEDAVRPNLTPLSLLRRAAGDRPGLIPDAVSRRPQAFYWLAGMCVLFDAAAYRAVGGFDERFFLYCEDYDICARLYNAGYALAVEPAVTVVHAAQRDSHRSARHLRWHLASLVRVWTSRAFWRLTLRR